MVRFIKKEEKCVFQMWHFTKGVKLVPELENDPHYQSSFLDQSSPENRRRTSKKAKWWFNGFSQFLGGLSLHLNHLIGSRMANYDWPFGTLPLGLFGSNLDTRDLETYPRTYCGHFWHMSLFDDSRAVWVFLRKWVVSENQSFLDEGAIVTYLINLVLGGQVPRLNHGPIWLAGQNT